MATTRPSPLRPMAPASWPLPSTMIPATTSRPPRKCLLPFDPPRSVRRAPRRTSRAASRPRLSLHHLHTTTTKGGPPSPASPPQRAARPLRTAARGEGASESSRVSLARSSPVETLQRPPYRLPMLERRPAHTRTATHLAPIATATTQTPQTIPEMHRHPHLDQGHQCQHQKSCRSSTRRPRCVRPPLLYLSHIPEPYLHPVT